MPAAHFICKPLPNGGLSCKSRVTGREYEVIPTHYNRFLVSNKEENIHETFATKDYALAMVELEDSLIES